MNDMDDPLAGFEAQRSGIKDISLKVILPFCYCSARHREGGEWCDYNVDALLFVCLFSYFLTSGQDQQLWLHGCRCCIREPSKGEEGTTWECVTGC